MSRASRHSGVGRKTHQCKLHRRLCSIEALSNIPRGLAMGPVKYDHVTNGQEKGCCCQLLLFPSCRSWYTLHIDLRSRARKGTHRLENAHFVGVLPERVGISARDTKGLRRCLDSRFGRQRCLVSRFGRQGHSAHTLLTVCR